MAKVTLEQMREFFAREFPQALATVEQVGDLRAVVRQPVSQGSLRPGETISGPVMMAAADHAAYVAVLGEIGIVPLAVTTSLHIDFLRLPEAGCAIIADARLIKLGRRLAVADVRIFSEGKDAEVAHASVTYSIPPRIE